MRQSQIDKLYAGLKDLTRERRARLDETLKLYGLHREIDDLLQWIAEKEVVAGSQEAGQDYEHVQVSTNTPNSSTNTSRNQMCFHYLNQRPHNQLFLLQMLQERFTQFARDVESIGSERVARANDQCDALIAIGHTDAPQIALYKDNLNEAWENLLGKFHDTNTYHCAIKTKHSVLWCDWSLSQ